MNTPHAFDLVVRGGTIVTEAERRDACDVGVLNGCIAALGPGLARGREEIDARHLLVLPGGVDTHCHLAQWALGASPFTTSSD